MLAIVILLSLVSHLYAGEAAIPAPGPDDPVTYDAPLFWSYKHYPDLNLPGKTLFQGVEDTRCPEPTEERLFPSIIASGKAAQLKDLLGECVYNMLYKTEMPASVGEEIKE